MLTLDLSYMANRGGAIDADELRMVKAYLRRGSFTAAQADTGHDRATIAESWRRFRARLTEALDSYEGGAVPPHE